MCKVRPYKNGSKKLTSLLWSDYTNILFTESEKDPMSHCYLSPTNILIEILIPLEPPMSKCMH